MQRVRMRNLFVGAVVLATVTASAVVGAVFVGASPSLAYERVWTLNLHSSDPGIRTTIRLYNRPDLATTGRDGWCYRGVAHPNDWACNVDTSNDRRRFQATVTANTRFYNYTNKNWVTASFRPQWPGQAPMCLPDWHRFGTPYHRDPWGGYNHYLCGFFS